MTHPVKAFEAALRNAAKPSDVAAAEEAYHKTSEALSRVTKELSLAHDANQEAYQRYRNNHSIPVQIAYDKTKEAVSRLSREQNSAIDDNEYAYGELKQVRRAEVLHQKPTRLGNHVTTPIQDFLEALAPKLHIGDRVIAIQYSAPGSSDFSLEHAMVTLYNVPKKVFHSDGHSEQAQANSNAYFVDAMSVKKTGNVQVEQLLQHNMTGGVGSFPRLSKKTGTPERVAAYLAAHLNYIAASVPPKRVREFE